MLEIDLGDIATPRLPHLMMLQYVPVSTGIITSTDTISMQYHQIVIFTHRPWVSKNYIQPRAPRQGPGYHHARRMCIESATAVARLLQLYEKHYTFRRMNNQIVAIIFSAALMLLYVTISHAAPPGKSPTDVSTTNNAEMVGYLNLCFRALDELGQSFENAKRTRDFLVSLQRRWQARMRRSGSAVKRQPSNMQLPQQAATATDPSSRKKTRLTPPGHPHSQQQNMFMASPAFTQQQQHDPNLPADQTQPFDSQQGADLDWLRNSDFQLLSGSLGDGGFPQMMGPSAYTDQTGLPNISDIEGWWDSPGEGGFGGSSF